MTNLINCPFCTYRSFRDAAALGQHVLLSHNTGTPTRYSASGWTQQHERILEEGHKAGKSARAIAEELSGAGYPATRNTVLGRVHRNGWSKPTPRPEPAVVVAIATSAGCRWPIGHPGTADFRFCEEPKVVFGKPYCFDHCAKAYRQPDEKTEGPHAPKPQRAGTYALVPTVSPMRGRA